MHLTRNLCKICSKKQASIVIQGFKKIYTASNLKLAQLELENFKEKFSALPKVVAKVKNDIQYLEQLFKLPEEIRKAIYTKKQLNQ